MQETILHIGMHKTGTSSIQASLKNFDDGTLRYAHLGHSNHSDLFMTVFSENAEDYHVHKRRGLSSDEVEKLRKSMRSDLEREFQIDRQRLVISGEDISALSKPAVKRLHAFLQDRTETVTVIAYVREPVSFVSSAFQGMVRGGRSSPDLPEPRYRYRFKKFLDLFGADRVHFVHFDKTKFSNGSVVSDFCERIGIPAPRNLKDTENESLSEEATKLLFLFNRYGALSTGSPELMEARHKMVACLANALNGDKFVVPKPMIRQSLNLADIDWMESVSGFKLKRNIESSDTADTSFEEFIESVDHNTIQELKNLLNKRKIKYKDKDELSLLMSKLYYSFITKRILDDSDIDSLKSIASKIEDKSKLDLNDAQILMKVAQKIRPNGPFIAQKIQEYQQKLQDKRPGFIRYLLRNR
ncbi:hypothetical protein [Hoeflea sp.]|uniref:hypothetical protein n=1 Tax=Hoeflea sp. TaxID=1940281 RepID=UPI003B01FA84